MKKIIEFEGFGGAGKTTLIRYLYHDLSPDLKIEILDKNHPHNSSLLFTNSKDIVFEKKKFSNFSFRWTRLFLYLNHILSSNSDIFILDRGILTSYIHGKNDNIPESVLTGLIDELLSHLNNFDYRTIFVKCDIDTADRRLISKANIDIELKKSRNQIFKPFYDTFKNYWFINSFFEINTTISVFNEYDKLLEYIKTAQNA